MFEQTLQYYYLILYCLKSKASINFGIFEYFQEYSFIYRFSISLYKGHSNIK